MNSACLPSTYQELENRAFPQNLCLPEIQKVSRRISQIVCSTIFSRFSLKLYSGNPHTYTLSVTSLEPPGKAVDLKVTDSTYTTLSLSWTKPKEEAGVQDGAKGYFVDIRPAENPEWDRCNTNAIIMTTYTVKGMKSMGMYWVRVVATNEGGEGEPQELNNYVLAMPPPGE